MKPTRNVPPAASVRRPPHGGPDQLLAVGSPIARITRHTRLVGASALALIGVLLASAAASTPAQADPARATSVCGQPVLRSPYSYEGAAGSYASGTPGLPSYGSPDSDFPNATSGVVLPADNHYYLSYELAPDTVYYLAPGLHEGGFQAKHGDVFVGGASGETTTTLSGNYLDGGNAIDSNWSDGNQSDVTVEYLTIEKYTPAENAAALNQDTNTNWTFLRNTVRLNVPGAGIFAGTGNVLRENCLTENGQYGFQSAAVNSWGRDAVTDGPYGLTIAGNEISFNDTCDFAGLLNNEAIGWNEYDPVPSEYRNPHCGNVTPDGDQGGFKLWSTNGVTITRNYIHNNWGVGAWADTNNANTTISENYFADNEGVAVDEEVSYNFAITDNTMVGNDITGGLANPWFPQPAVYISESGSDDTFGGVPACSEAACSGQPSYTKASIVSGNVMTNNGGNVFLWQSANRYCGDGFDNACPLVDGGQASPFTAEACTANSATTSIDTTTYIGNTTGSPSEDWWDGCLWKTENVHVSDNTITFHPSEIEHCNEADWFACGAGGIFSNWGSSAPYNQFGEMTIPTQLTFHQGNTWTKNTYNGPSPFYAWNQGNKVTWDQWNGALSEGDECGNPDEKQAGYCAGPFGQDSGGTYNPES